MKSLVYFLILLIYPRLLYGQKKFEVSFSFPDSAEIKKLSFFYYDCHLRELRPVSASYSNNQATISHSYNTVYAQIYVEYGSTDYKHGMTIFTTEKPAKVMFSGVINEADPFRNYTLVNAQDPKQEFLAEEEYIREAQNTYKQIYDSIAPKWKSEDSLDFHKVKDAKMAIDSKRLEYISSHPNSYSSFYLFEKYSIRVLPPDLLLQQFATTFPANFRNSEEGACIKKYILNRAVVEGQKKAISFTANDINANKVIFEEIYNKKNVLLVFWGTWCPPCIDEIPIIREIRQRYSKEQLEIISVAVESPLEKVQQIIKEQQIDWINIVNDKKINLLYQINAYPEVFLIENKGNIIYKYSDYPDPNLGNLKKILAAHATIH
ncbi:TlpA family protein disulfide reductase [Chitinophaga tropicalis]|uniref:Redoxin domain-containing protein n=1 Tax=Chitinophaga tropicalis TaxID=2683588 RepID=A0A7K1U4N0_9BACT|nr:TlpA disulfide reductase family protein [Chitinophaga tropicalis]MVT09289.1 redoxin domain-containing protein [Chitinophaga tropicalis]